MKQIFNRIWRQLSAKPGFSVVVIATLALTIGAATTVFSLFDAVLLRPFPYPHPDRLARVRTWSPQVKNSLREVSLYDYFDYRDRNRSFQSLAAYVTYANNLTGRGPAQSVRMTFTSPELFPLLGVKPVLGRLFAQGDDKYNGDVRKVVLSYSLWQQLFGGKASALGQIIQMRGQGYVVTGVMPPGFAFPSRTEVWVPLMARYSAYAEEWWKRRDARAHSVVGRLRDGITIEQASSDLRRISLALAKEYSETNHDTETKILSLRDAEAGELRPYVLLVGAAVGLLLLIGCVNVANLFVARGAGREREFAIRAALGSGGRQLVQQLLGEGLVFGLIGGVLGVLLAWLGVTGLLGLLPVDLPSWLVLRIDSRVLAFTLLCSVVTAVFFGLAPALQHLRPNLNEVLKQGSKGSSGRTSLAGRLRRSLVVVEIALSLILLVGAGLMLRSLGHLMSANTGVKTERLVIASVGRYLPNTSPEQQVIGYSNEFRRLRDRLATIPGVLAVSGGDDVPYLNQPEQRSAGRIYTHERTTFDRAYRGPATGADVMPGYFDVLGVRILAGHDFTEADGLDKPKVMLINQYAAQTLFPGRSAVGEQIRWGDDENYDPWMKIIGVVSDTKWNPAEQNPGIEVYWSYRQYPSPQHHLLIRSTIEPQQLMKTIRRTAREVNPDLAFERVKTMETVAREAIWQRRLWGMVMAVFAVLALLLAAVGLYGVMNFLVTQRTREMGIRLAIGAPPASIRVLILSSGMRLVFAGILIGLAGAFAGARLMSTLLFNVSSADPITFTVVPTILAGIAVLSCLAPAWKASTVDPLVALREE